LNKKASSLAGLFMKKSIFLLDKRIFLMILSYSKKFEERSTQEKWLMDIAIP
jgi:hypothetical protein